MTTNKKIIGIVVLVFLLVVWGGFIIRVNCKYHPTKVEQVGMNELIESDGIQFIVKNAHFYTTEELKETLKFPEEFFYNEDMCVIALEMELKNVSNKTIQAETAYRRIETLGWSGGVDLNMYAYFNQNNKVSVRELDKGESTSFILPYPIISDNFTEKDWKEILKKEYQYIISIYPIKKTVTLEFDSKC